MTRTGTRLPTKSFLTSRFRSLFLLPVLCGGSFLFLIINHSKNMTCFKSVLTSQNKLTINYKQQFMIKTEGCTIPSMKPLDDRIKQFIGYPDDTEKCRDSNTMLLKHNKTHIWIQKEIAARTVSRYREHSGFTTISCCYKAFYRPDAVENIYEYSDNRVKYKECVYFSDIVKVKDEFVRVTCNLSNTNTNKSIHDDFFLFAQRKINTAQNDNKETPNNKTSYNVIVMGIDGVSRLNVYRTMPKTIKFLKNKGAVDLAGYNKVGDNTFPNIIPMLLGITMEELPQICQPYKGATFDNCPFIWQWFKQAGYYTAFAEDSSWLGTFDYLRPGFCRTPTDYYIHTFINEGEILARENRSSLCLNDRYFYKILLDYEEDILLTLKPSKLFGFFWEVTMSHDYLNYPMVMDDSYVTFFETLETINYLDETILFLVSDHGIRWGPMRSTKQGRLEERLPFVFIIVPRSFQETFTEAFNNLKLNSNRLTTPFDLHSTLSDLIDLNNIKNERIVSRSTQSYGHNRNISLFLLIPGNRTCQIAGINDHWCTCHKETTISNTSIEAIEASAHLITYLNNLLTVYPKCSQLTISEIIEAVEMVAVESDKEEVDWREFMIVVRTHPGNGVFEATLRHTDTEWSLAGTVSRLNLYGNQSHCMQDNLLKLYCYCIDIGDTLVK